MNDIQKTIFSLHLKKSTGRLSLARDGSKKEIYFKRGHPIFIESNVRSEALGQILLSEGKITDAQLQQTLDLMLATGKKQGECLVELGLLSAYEVYQELGRQMEKKFQNCFLFEGATTAFQEGDSHLQEVPEFQIDAFHTILDFFSFYLEEDRLAGVPSDKAFAYTALGKEYFAAQKLLPHEAKLARHFDGKKNLEQIVDLTEGDPDFIRLFLIVTLGFKLVELVELRRDVPKPVPTESKENVVVIRDETPPEKKEASSPIYTWALKLGRPLPEMLDVKPTTPKAQVQRNFDRIVRELKLENIDAAYEGKDREVAHSIFDRLTAALAVFTQESLLKLYVQSQSNKTNDFHPRIKAETHIQKGKFAAHNKDFAKAEVEVEKAIQIDDKEPGYWVILGDFLIKRASHEGAAVMPKKASEALHKAIEINPNHLDAYLTLGTYYKQNKELEKAISQFNKCIELSPNHAMANSELRLLHKRLTEQKKPSSVPFAGLFKAKEKPDPKKKS